jgi:hypothetical protein
VNELAGEQQESVSDRASTFTQEDVLTEDGLTEGDDFQDVDTSARGGTAVPPAREGLPPSFRMRHDAHYVDELTSRTAPAARATITPETNGDSIAALVAPAALWELTGDIELAIAQAGVCRREGRFNWSAADVLTAHLARAARVARAAAIMLEPPRLHRRIVTARALVDAAAAATSTARRLAGVALEISIDDPDFQVPADLTLVSQALAGAIDVLLAFGDEAPVEAVSNQPASLGLTVLCVKTRPAMIIEVAQGAVSVEPDLIGVFFDGASTLHPGGASSAVRLAAAARIFRAHGGRVDVRRDTPVGCTVTFVLPQAVARTPEM